MSQTVPTKLPKASNSFWILLACVAVVVIIVIFLIFRIRILSEKLASICRDNTQRLTPDDVVGIVRQYGTLRAPACVPPASPVAGESPSPPPPAAVEDEAPVPSDSDTEPDQPATAVVLDDDGQETGDVLTAEKKSDTDGSNSEFDLSDVPDIELGPGGDVVNLSEKSEFASRMAKLAQPDSDADADDAAPGHPTGQDSPHSDFAQRMAAQAAKEQEAFEQQQQQQQGLPLPSISPTPSPSPKPAKKKARKAAKPRKRS